METIAIIVLAVLAVAPLLVWLWRIGPLAALAGATLWIACVGWAASAYRPPPVVDEASVRSRPIAVAEDGHVTSDKCRSCHPSFYESWKNSYHRTMTQRATPETIASVWEGRMKHRYWYELERRGDELWVRSNNPMFRAKRSTEKTGSRQVVMATGSHHEQMYWYSTGVDRGLAIFPMVYRIQEKQWIPFQGVLLTPAEGSTDATHVWNATCVRCHTTDARPKVLFEKGKFQEIDTQSSEFGIACEACHGAGEEHVRSHRNPVSRYASYLTGSEDADPTIVNPAKLDSQLAADVCGNCHSVHTQRTPDDVADFMADGFRFKPGDRLEDTRYIARYQKQDDDTAKRLLGANAKAFEDRFWPDGMPAVGGREYNGLTESPCYQNGPMTCTDCHSLHQADDDPRPAREWADDQLHAGMRSGNEACLQCHEGMRADESAHTHHESGSSGSLCYNCHMPNTAYGLLKHTRSHKVDSPRVARTLETGRQNACNLCHLDQPLAWTDQKLQEWYGAPATNLSDADHIFTSNAVLQALRGNAAQRAMAVWHMGWGPAREASGEEWMVPVLAQLLEDPYAAVRYLAHRSLITLTGFEDFRFEHIQEDDYFAERHRAALEIWDLSYPPESRQSSEAYLIDRDGVVNRERFARLLSKRDDKRVHRGE